jgi:hypothetical protein
MTDKTTHHLYRFIDKGLADTNYVVVDPLDSDGLIYLTPKEYKRSIQTWLSSGTDIVVLHNPNNPNDVQRLKSYDFKTSSVTSNDKNNPLYKKGFGRILSKRYALLSRLEDSWTESKMISLTNFKQLDLLTYFLRIVIPLSLARKLKDVSGKMWLTYRFIKYIKRVRAHHGTTYLVNYMKLSQLAISRAISGQPLGSLMELDSSHIYRSLSRSGLPRFIPSRDRIAIMQGSERTIRYYLTLYSLYRVIKAPAVPKLSTITAPPSYDVKFISELMKFFYEESKMILKSYNTSNKSSLNITEWINFETSSPTNSMSWKGMLSSLYFFERHYPETFKAIKAYVSLTQERGKSIASRLMNIYAVIESHVSLLLCTPGEFTIFKGEDPQVTQAEIDSGKPLA